MSFRHGLTGGLISGLIFAILMTTIHFSSKKKKNTSLQKHPDIIEVFLPKIVSYLCLFALVIFSLFTYLSWIAGEPKASVIFVFFAALSLVYLPTICSHAYIGKKVLIKKNYLFSYREKIYSLRDIKEIEVTMLKGFKIIFYDGSSTTLPAFSGSYMHLPEHEKSSTTNLQIEGLYRLGTEVLRRKEDYSSDNYNDEIQILRRQTSPIVSPKQIFIFFAVSIFLLISGAHLIQTRALTKISHNHPKDTGLRNFENAFLIFKGNKFYTLREQYEKECEKEKNYTCRFASYLYQIDHNPLKSNALMKISCHKDDPRSCYNVFIDNSFSKSDQAKATAILDEVCSQDNNSNLTCCSCYTKEKKIRLPANTDYHHPM